MSLSGVITRSKANQIKKDADEAARVVEAEVETTNQSGISTKSNPISSSSRLTKESRRTNNSTSTKTSLKGAKIKKAVLQARIKAQAEIHKIECCLLFFVVVSRSRTRYCWFDASRTFLNKRK